MNMGTSRFVCILIATLGLLSGCTGKRPFLLVQTCLGSEQSAVMFLSTMKEIAHSEKMSFVDRSKETQADLVRLKKDPGYRLINIGVEREDGVGLSAGNLGLSQYEVAIGFSEGSNPAQAHQFADLVVETLKRKWDIHVVPSDRGALPMKGCAGE
ncbi:hypothetical protein [Dyella terrae]|nr:hypothetical protein [Dyella terrae]